METNFEKYRKLTILLSIGLIILFLFLGGLLYIKAHKMESHWESFTDYVLKVNNALSDLHREMGYGGFIHNFKNLVLRRDIDRYSEKIESNIRAVESSVSTLESLDTDNSWNDALDSFRQVFNLYANNYNKTKILIKGNHSPSEIDAWVKVDDTEAIHALDQLLNQISFLHKNAINKSEKHILEINKLILISVFSQ